MLVSASEQVLTNRVAQQLVTTTSGNTCLSASAERVALQLFSQAPAKYHPVRGFEQGQREWRAQCRCRLRDRPRYCLLSIGQAPEGGETRSNNDNKIFFFFRYPYRYRFRI